MQLMNVSGVLVENIKIDSKWLKREVTIDCYLPVSVANPSQLGLLLINDGQNLEEMGFTGMLEYLYAAGELQPLLCVGIHAGVERKMEYGVSGVKDYLGRGARAADHASFVLDELIPFIKTKYNIAAFSEQGYAGFSLGGLTALDTVWKHPDQFSKAGIFSGSLWWRSKDQDDSDYDDKRHRIMHQQIIKGNYHAGLKFFFQCGNKDETKDRNNNGIIDSIDDTIDLIKELEKKGYRLHEDIFYLELPEGSHDIPTWASAMPVFLKWAWGINR